MEIGTVSHNSNFVFSSLSLDLPHNMSKRVGKYAHPESATFLK